MDVVPDKKDQSVTTPKSQTNDPKISSRNSSTSSSSDNSSLESVLTDSENDSAAPAHRNGNDSAAPTPAPSPQHHENDSILTLRSPTDAGRPVQQQLQSPRISFHGGGSGGYDPARIPASIFAAKSSTPTEWSVASNESLFSIHVGNMSSASFSKEHYLFGTPLFRSGELTVINNNYKLDQDRVTAAFTRVTAEEATYHVDTTAEIAAAEPPPRDTETRPCDKAFLSYNNAQSFQFPVLVNGRGGRISSPKMESKTRGATQMQPPQPTMQIMQRRERPQRLESKSEHHNSTATSWFCFSSSCCCPSYR